MSKLTIPLISYKHRGRHVPASLHPAIRAYIDEHRLPGHFLQAVICNDLSKALARADPENLDNIIAITGFFYNEAPSPCWGSKEKMVAWVARAKKDEDTDE